MACSMQIQGLVVTSMLSVMATWAHLEWDDTFRHISITMDVWIALLILSISEIPLVRYHHEETVTSLTDGYTISPLQTNKLLFNFYTWTSH